MAALRLNMNLNLNVISHEVEALLAALLLAQPESLLLQV